MDTEPSSDQSSTRSWGRAHRDTIRSLLQIVVVLTGALGLWLIGIDKQEGELLPATPAAVSWAPAPTSTSTASDPGPANHLLVDGGHPGERSDPGTAPERDVCAGEGAGAPDCAADVASVPPAAPPGADASQDTNPRQEAAQDAAAPDTAAQGAVPQAEAPPDAVQQDAVQQDAVQQDVVQQDASASISAPPAEVPPREAPAPAPSPDAAPPDTVVEVDGLRVDPVQDAPVQAGGEMLSLSASSERSPGVTAPGGVGGLPGLFTSILPTPTPSPVPSEPAVQWVWPVRGELSQGYSDAHRAIDLSTEQGAVVVAASAGTVVYAKWESTGYGYLVIIDHDNGFVSYYAHLYGFYIDVGYEVERGEQIGELGNTGRSTGPHLHFEIRQDGVQRDPLDLLP